MHPVTFIFFLSLITAVWEQKAERKLDWFFIFLRNGKIFSALWLAWLAFGTTRYLVLTRTDPVTFIQRQLESPLLIQGLAVRHNGARVPTQSSLDNITRRHHVTLVRWRDCRRCTPYWQMRLAPLDPSRPNPTFRDSSHPTPTRN